MDRTIPYRGFEIRITLSLAAEDMYDVTFQITGHNVDRTSVDGTVVNVRRGPFSQRWAYLVGEIAGQAAIDIILGPEQ